MASSDPLAKELNVIRTNAFSLLCVAIRAIVIFVLASALVQFPSIFVALRQQAADGGSLGWVIAGMAVSLGLLVLIWLYADKLARLALAHPQEPVFDSDIEPRVWLGLAVSLIGAWFLFFALKNGVYLLMQWMLLSRANADVLQAVQQQPDFIARAVSAVFEVVLAIVFLLRGQGLARWVQRMRYGSAASDTKI
jgi:hypothetical protein